MIEGEPPAVTEELVVCSLEAWDDVWRRNQFLVRELLAMDVGIRVLFVEPPHDVLYGALRGRLPRGLGLRPVGATGRLWAMRPVKTLPRILGGAADRSLFRQVRRTARRLGFDDPLLWINDAVYGGLGERTGWSVVYDITDDWLLAAAAPREIRRRRRREAALLSRANEVVVCSKALAGTRGAFREVHLIPNAVDLEHFTRPQPRPPDLPTSPVAVYVGTLHEDRLDTGLLIELGHRCPDLQVALVGPDSLSAAARDRLSALANVHRLGSRPYAVVPAYLQHADVLIVPHVVSAFTESLDPIKAYECLAIGRPTVATAVAHFRDLGPPVKVAPRDHFASTVIETLRTPPVARGPAGVPTWRERAVAFSRVLERARLGGG